jgi:hypothetical protein
MNALLWKGYGISDIYLTTEDNFEKVKETVLGIMFAVYEKDVIIQIEDADFWGELVDVVRTNSYGDNNFESFEIVEVQE